MKVATWTVEVEGGSEEAIKSVDSVFDCVNESIRVSVRAYANHTNFD